MSTAATARSRAQDRARKDDIIQVRTSSETKAILNQAAALRGQKLSEFILMSARREAQDAILDQRAFFLSPKEHEEFLQLLDAPDKPSKKLRKLASRKPAWER